MEAAHGLKSRQCFEGMWNGQHQCGKKISQTIDDQRAAGIVSNPPISIGSRKSMELVGLYWNVPALQDWTAPTKTTPLSFVTLIDGILL